MTGARWVAGAVELVSTLDVGSWSSVVVVVVVVVRVAAVGVVGVAEDEVAVDRVALGVDDLDVVQQPVEGLRLADLGDQLGHEVVALVGLADLVRLLADLHGDALVLGGEVASSASSPSATATARRARSTLTACSEAPFMPSTNAPASWPVTDSHCSMSMPCACSWRTVPSTRRCRSLCTSDSGGSISVSPVSASVTRPTSSWRAWLSLASLEALAIDARHASTVSNSPRFSPTHSSVSSGSTSSCTAPTVTTKSAGSSVPFGVVVNVSSSPADGADRAARRSRRRPSPGRSRRTSPRCSARRPPRRRGWRARSSVTKSPLAAGRSTSVSSPWRRSWACTASSTSSSVAVGRRQLDAQPAVAGHGDLGTHLAGGVEPDGPVLLARR